MLYLNSYKKTTSPDYMKVCGKINIENNKIESISTSDFGKIDDGNFVEDEKACKSGFALYFYINGNTYGTTDMDTGKICVNVKGVEIGDKLDDCIIDILKELRKNLFIIKMMMIWMKIFIL